MVTINNCPKRSNSHMKDYGVRYVVEQECLQKDYKKTSMVVKR